MVETPQSPDSLYAARGEEVDEHRPLFTGDVWETPSKDLLIVLQHPCALRRGDALEEQILCATVAPQDKGFRSNWANESSRLMPLPDLLDDGADYRVEFTQLVIKSPSDFSKYKRLLTASNYGVNLLLQRWVHHNSRVVIKTVTFNEQTAGPFEEAELKAEWCSELHSQGIDASAEFENWIREEEAPGAGRRQSQLVDPQLRAHVRRAMRRTIGARRSP